MINAWTGRAQRTDGRRRYVDSRAPARRDKMPGCDWSLAGDRLTNRRRAFAVFSDARLLLMRDTTWRYDAIRYAWLPSSVIDK